MKKVLNKKRIKIMGVLLLGIITSFWRSNWVCADDITVHTNKYYSEYFITANLESKLYFNHFRIYSFNDRPAYALDVDNNVVVWGYYYTDDYLSRGLTKEQIEYIQLVAYYGYEYPGHRDDYRYFMVAQELILEYLLGVDFYWTEKMEINAEEVDLSGYKNEILALVSKHSILPSFNLTTNNYLLGEEIKLVDTNNVLSNYEVVDSDGLATEISNNSLVIQTEGASAGEYTLHLKKKSYIDDLAYVYYADKSQTLFTPGKIEDIEAEVKIKIEGASLKIQKYNNKTFSDIFLGMISLKDSKYGLYDINDNLVTTVIIDEKGQALVENLSFGTYKLKELEASYGYKLDENIYTIDINQKENEFVVYGDTVKKKLEIYKTYGEDKLFDNSCIFDILSSDGELYKSITTDKNGYASAVLPYGKYIVSQKSNRDGYQKIDDLEIEVNSNCEEIMSYNLHSDILSLSDIVSNDEVLEYDTIVENPQTNDDILKNIVSLVVTVFLLIVICIYIVRKNVL